MSEQQIEDQRTTSMSEQQIQDQRTTSMSEQQIEDQWTRRGGAKRESEMKEGREARREEHDSLATRNGEITEGNNSQPSHWLPCALLLPPLPKHWV
jgi:ketosteroid isomerase-like protein